MRETLGEHKAPFQKLNNQFEVSDHYWEPWFNTCTQENKDTNFSTHNV